MVTPSRRRDVVKHLCLGLSRQRALRLQRLRLRRASQRYRSMADPQDELRLRLKELAASRVRYGYRRLHVLLRREGWPVNHKRIYRLYRIEGLVIRQKTPRRKRSSRYRGDRLDITQPNQTWAMDFVSDSLFNGAPIRILTVVDCHTRESLSVEPRASFPGLPRRRGAGPHRPRARPAEDDPLRQRAGVCRPCAGPVGLLQPGRAGLLTAGDADRQRLHRIVQRPSTPGAAQRVLVPVAG